MSRSSVIKHSHEKRSRNVMRWYSRDENVTERVPHVLLKIVWSEWWQTCSFSVRSQYRPWFTYHETNHARKLHGRLESYRHLIGNESHSWDKDCDDILRLDIGYGSKSMSLARQEARCTTRLHGATTKTRDKYYCDIEERYRLKLDPKHNPVLEIQKGIADSPLRERERSIDQLE